MLVAGDPNLSNEGFEQRCQNKSSSKKASISVARPWSQITLDVGSSEGLKESR